MEKYNGNQKGFIYASFDARNQEEVLSKYLEPLSKDGVPFWWADGFDGKEEKTLSRAGAVLLFLTKDYVKESKLRDAVAAAVRNDKPILSVYLEDVDLDAGLSMQLESQQALFRSRFKNDEVFTEALKKAAIFDKLQVSDQQKGRQKSRSIIAIAAAVIAVLVLAIVIKPMLGSKANADTMEALGLQGMSKEDLESIESLRIVGNEIVEYDTYAAYDGGDKTRIVYTRDVHDNAGDEDPQTTDAGTITDLSGVEQLKNLKVLVIEGQQIEDITPILGLENLEVLSINCNPVSSIKGIDKLKNLRILDISYTDVSDITPVFGLEKLTRLRLDGTNVTDLSGIESMRRLHHLTISDTGISEIPDGLVLELLVAHNSALKSVPDFGGAQGVFFSAQGMNWTDYSGLSTAKSFGLLNIEVRNGLDEQLIKALNGIHIEKADILESNFDSLKELSGWDVGEELELSNGGLSSLEGIEHFEGIETLDLRNCRNLTDLSPINALEHAPRVILSPDMEHLSGVLNENIEVEIGD